jgi:hypothetical protein
MAWNSSAWQTATIIGPVAGGLLYGVSAEAAYGTALAFMLTAALLVLSIPKPAQRTAGDKPTLETLFAGFGYIRREKVVLGAISLDLFAVLFGGAVALLPLFASDVLHVGKIGLGLLRSAPAFGALVASVLLVRRPIGRYAGRKLIAVVAAFGVCMVAFGLSRTMWLSLLALAVSGGVDLVSVVLRQTILPLVTPDELRGRVNAVEMVFISASNELGAFESGVAAALVGAVPAVVAGGIATIAIAAVWTRLFPPLFEVDRLEELLPE